MFSRKEKKQLVNSFDLLHQTVIKPEPNPFDQMLELSEILLEGRGVLALFSDIEDEITATHVLAFLSGVVYALNGSVYQISNETYLFAGEEALKDGTLAQYIKEVGEE